MPEIKLQLSDRQENFLKFIADSVDKSPEEALRLMLNFEIDQMAHVWKRKLIQDSANDPYGALHGGAIVVPPPMSQGEPSELDEALLEKVNLENKANKKNIEMLENINKHITKGDEWKDEF